MNLSQQRINAFARHGYLFELFIFDVAKVGNYANSQATRPKYKEHTDSCTNLFRKDFRTKSLQRFPCALKTKRVRESGRNQLYQAIEKCGQFAERSIIMTRILLGIPL